MLDESLLAAVVRWIKTNVQESKTSLGLALFAGTVQGFRP